MPDIWTLSYNGGEPAILKDFGICADFTITHSNRQKATATFRTNEGFDAADAPQFAFMGKGAIYRNGALFFQGYFDDPIQELEGNRQYIHYRLHDAWWLFERHSFKQWRNQFGGWINGDPNQGPILTPVVAPEVYLGETVNEVWQTNGMQVVEIINWVNECHNPTKRGATTGRDNAQDVVQACRLPVHDGQEVQLFSAEVAVALEQPLGLLAGEIHEVLDQGPAIVGKDLQGDVGPVGEHGARLRQRVLVGRRRRRTRRAAVA